MFCVLQRTMLAPDGAPGPTTGSRALKAEIDEAARTTLYSTLSRPFAPPTTGKIAVKVINHYGGEVLKVYEVGDWRSGRQSGGD
jgi:hypothetical protein